MEQMKTANWLLEDDERIDIMHSESEENIKPGGIWMSLMTKLDSIASDVDDDENESIAIENILRNYDESTLFFKSTEVAAAPFSAIKDTQEDNDNSSQNPSEMSTSPSGTVMSSSVTGRDSYRVDGRRKFDLRSLGTSQPQRGSGWEASRKSQQKRLPPMEDPNQDALIRMLNIRPPRSEGGVHILTSDVREVTHRMHERLARLRYSLSAISGYDTSLQVPGGDKGGDKQSAINGLASVAVASLRHNPRPIVATIAHNLDRDDVLSQLIASIAVQRLLHPYSSDSSATSALLLDALNFRIDQVSPFLAEIEAQSPTPPTPRDITARAVFITELDKVCSWNPISEPLPLVTNAFTCLLKSYAIRSDVTSFFCATWRRLIPLIDDFVRLEKAGSKPPMTKMFTLASRILDTLFNHEVMVIFPTTATALCHSIYEIGGAHSAHMYLLNYLILPNLIKIMTGDHSSLENEMVLRGETVESLSMKYFDVETWWPLPGSRRQTHRGETGSLRTVIDVVWLVWRLYTGAVLIKDPLSTTLSTDDFFEGGPCVDYNCVFDLKIRNQLFKLQRRIEVGLELLLHMPLDIHSNFFLGTEAYSKLKDIDLNFEGRKALQKRLFAVMIRPPIMTSTVVVSKAEIGTLFAEIVLALDQVGSESTTALCRVITEYLLNQPSLQPHSEEILVLTAEANSSSSAFPSCSSNNSDADFVLDNIIGVLQDLPTAKDSGSSPELIFSYEQLLRGLKLSLHFEDTIKRLQAKCDNQDITSHIRDEIFYSAEYDEQYKLDTEETVFDKVTTSWLKKSKATKVKVLRGGEIISPKATAEGHANQLKSFENKLRFDTVGSVPHDTSLGARHPVAPKKPTDSDTSVSKLNTSTRSNYTRIEVKPSAQFLAPTESLRHKSDVSLRKTQRDIDREYLTSMRAHQIIPTHKFMNKRNNRGKNTNSNRSPPSSSARGYTESDSPRKSNVLPFPEHLRSRVRSPDSEEGFLADELRRVKEKLLTTAYNIHGLEASELFDSIDKNGTGCIKVADLSGVVLRFLPSISERQLRHFIGAADVNGTGEIARDYFIEFIGQRHQDDIKIEEIDDDDETFEEESLRFRPLSPEVDSSAHFRAATASFKSHIVTKDQAANESRFLRDNAAGFVPGLRGSPKGYFDKSFAQRRPISPRPRSPATSSSIPRLRAKSASNSNRNRLKKVAEKLEAAPVIIPIPEVSPPDHSNPSSYSYLRPCVEEETEAVAEIKRRAEALGRLRKKFAEERELGRDPHYNDVEDEGYLRSIFDGPAISNSYDAYPDNDKAQYSHAQYSTSGTNLNHEENEPQSRKVGAPIIERKNTLTLANALTFLEGGVEALKHGRAGNPKVRTVAYDPESQEFRWKPDPQKTGGLLGRIFSNSTIVARNMLPGIKLFNITAVTTGLNTEVLLRAKLPDPGGSMSIVTKDRTLDLTLKSHSDRNMFIKCIKKISESELPSGSIRFT